MAAKAKKKTWHTHGCVRCHHRYDDACSTPGEDGLCEPCRIPGRRRPWDFGQNDPIACCPDNTREIYDKKVLTSFRLAGTGPWFRCTVCLRTFPHVRPAKENP